MEVENADFYQEESDSEEWAVVQLSGENNLLQNSGKEN